MTTIFGRYLELTDYSRAENWKELLQSPSSNWALVKIAVDWKEWQLLRVSLHGMSLEYRWHELKKFIAAGTSEEWFQPVWRSTPYTDREHRQIVVCNYVNALKRGGMVK